MHVFHLSLCKCFVRCARICCTLSAFLRSLTQRLRASISDSDCSRIHFLSDVSKGTCLEYLVTCFHIRNTPWLLYFIPDSNVNGAISAAQQGSEVERHANTDVTKPGLLLRQLRVQGSSGTSVHMFNQQWSSLLASLNFCSSMQCGLAWFITIGLHSQHATAKGVNKCQFSEVSHVAGKEYIYNGCLSRSCSIVVPKKSLHLQQQPPWIKPSSFAGLLKLPVLQQPANYSAKCPNASSVRHQQPLDNSLKRSTGQMNAKINPTCWSKSSHACLETPQDVILYIQGQTRQLVLAP